MIIKSPEINIEEIISGIVNSSAVPKHPKCI